MRPNKETLYAMALTMLGLTTATSAGAQVPGAGRDCAIRTMSALQTASLEVGKPEITKMDIIADGETTRIVIVGTMPFTPDVRNYVSPAATVITIGGRWNAGRKGITSVHKNGVNNVRAGQFSDAPAQVRIVANTQGVLPFRTEPSADRTRWEIVMGTADALKASVTSEIKPTLSAKTVASRPAPTPAIAPAPPRVDPGKVMIVDEKPTAAPVQVASAGAIAPALLAAGFHQVAGTKRANRVEIRTPGEAAGQAAEQPPPEEGRRVSLDFVDADINDVLKALSLQSGINIVTSKDVKGTITCSLRRVSFREALDTVVNLSGYKYARIGSTYAVGTAESVAALLRGSGLGEQVTESISFIFSDGSSLKTAIETAFPSLKGHVALVTIGTEGKTSTSSALSTGNEAAGETVGPAPQANGQGTAPATAGPAKQAPPSDRSITEKLVPKGGVISVTGTPAEVNSVKQFIESTERALLEAPAREAEAKERENMAISARTTEIYQIRYAAAVDLIANLNAMVPAVSVRPGPAQGFQPNALGGSASFTTGGAAAGAVAGGAPAAGQASGGPAGAGAGANTTPGGNPSGRPSSTLLLSGSAEAIARAREVLAQLDVRVAQISYEARVIDSTMDDVKNLGFTYDFAQPIRVGEINPNVTDLGPTTGQLPHRESQFGAIFRTPYSIGATLDALETKGKVRTLARPNLTAMDGQPAVAFIGDQIKYIISIQQTPQGQTIATETATVGITLRVTGKTSPDGTVTVYVHPEVSVISQFLNLGNGISLPQIATRFVDTTVRVKDGETFALGGLMRQQDVDNLRKVPYIGDLPILGPLLFQHKNKEKHNSEVAILITPRILKD